MSRKFMFVLLLTLIVMISAKKKNSFCKIESCKAKGKHTLCMFRRNSVAKRCLQPDDEGGEITVVDKSNIITQHNVFRQFVAGGQESRGSNGPQPGTPSRAMPNLHWNITLAKIAQTWADRCSFGHDKCRDVRDYQVGQNIADIAVPLPKFVEFYADLSDMIQDWYEQVQYFDKDEVKKFSGNLKGANGKDISYYTQIVWAKTKQIGCGARNYREGNFTHRYLVCNYGPAGNIPGEAIYPTN